MNETESETYRVTCDECGVVEFDVLDENRFVNQSAALWYAGYHGGKEHGDEDYQFGMVEPVEE